MNEIISKKEFEKHRTTLLELQYRINFDPLQQRNDIISDAIEYVVNIASKYFELKDELDKVVKRFTFADTNVTINTKEVSPKKDIENYINSKTRQKGDEYRRSLPTFNFKSCMITNLNKFIIVVEEVIHLYGENVPITIFDPKEQTEFCIYAKKNCKIEIRPKNYEQPMDNIECEVFAPNHMNNVISRLYHFIKKCLIDKYSYKGTEEICIGEDNDCIAILANPECVYIIPNNMFLR